MLLRPRRRRYRPYAKDEQNPDSHRPVSELINTESETPELAVAFDMTYTDWKVAAFLGIDHREMAGLTPSIIEFADIGAFIDAPVKTYSTGMRARLGF